MGLKCLFGHDWVKFMGYEQWNNQGKFMQRYKCTRCGKIKKEFN